MLWESNTICRYLAAREHRHDLLPATARERACVEQWMDWLANRHTQILEGQLERTGAYVVGADFTLADIVIGLAAERWLIAPIEPPATRPALPSVHAYRERLLTRPGFRQHGANGQP